ncbi:MAG: NAD-glutamate dehydrogenase [Phycisphaerales bacterium]
MPPTPATAPSTHDAASTVNELAKSFRETAESVVPWFFSQMPPMYFQDTDRASQMSHLRAIIAAKASGRPLEMTLRSEDNRQWTLMRPGNRPGVLAELVSSLPRELSLRAAKIHSARDGQLVLDTFEFGEQVPYDAKDARQQEKLKQTIAYAQANGADWTADQIAAYFANCTAEYVLTLTPLRICKHNSLFRAVSGSDGAIVELEPEADPTVSRLTIAYANARTRTMLERTAKILAEYKVSINRAYLDVVKDPPFGTVTFTAYVVQTAEGRAIDPKSDLWKSVRHDLERIKWIDETVQDLAKRHPHLGLSRAEAILGLAHLVHQVLCPVNPFAYTHDRLLAAAEEQISISTAIVDLLVARFDPAKQIDDKTFATRAAGLHADIESKVSEPGRTILHKMLEAVEHTLRTNYFLPRRSGFALRLDPKFLKNPNRPESPYGTFFVHGRGFDGFHNRFGDIARGGLRVIRPTTPAQWAREAERLFDEVYGLSWAQQLKNKDIPEGGAKCAILVRPGDDITRCVKAFVDCMLDLITPDPEITKHIVDRFGKPEFIYLGPDENITPDHINWIVARARRRKYGMPTAFMSSKPDAGINHKVYGVTSEGVTVFLEVALLARGINPRKQPFTVKITGGPDGDVAGNMIKILDREYGQNARIVGIADASGSGEDPNGLDHGELLRLFKAELPIASFDRKKLSPQGRIVSIDEPDGAKLRNTLHNRIVSDAFVPGGGRPATINESNWRDYLTADGKPSSAIIAEGANLFLTPEARKLLCAEGCLIFKDSSANKCGVICSSFEIDACMVLSDEEFLKIKDAYVKDVLDRLRSLARQEALLLMAEGRRHPNIPLPEISTQLSKVMNGAAAAIAAALPNWPEASKEHSKALVLEHLPAALTKYAGDRIWKSIPEAYLIWLKAKRLAANIVYREGIDFFSSLDPAAIGEVARRYLEKDIENRRLIEDVAKSNLAEKDRIVTLLERAGTRGALQDF